MNILVLVRCSRSTPNNREEPSASPNSHFGGFPPGGKAVFLVNFGEEYVVILTRLRHTDAWRSYSGFVQSRWTSLQPDKSEKCAATQPLFSRRFATARLVGCPLTKSSFGWVKLMYTIKRQEHREAVNGLCGNKTRARNMPRYTGKKENSHHKRYIEDTRLNVAKKKKGFLFTNGSLWIRLCNVVRHACFVSFGNCCLQLV